MILLTGFDPFGPYTFNPTIDIVKFFNGKYLTIEGDDDYLKARKIVGEILPATYDSFKFLLPLIKKHQPYAVVNLGFSSSVKGLQFENMFYNEMGDFKYPDNKEYNPNPRVKVIEEENTILEGGFDPQDIIDKLWLEDIPASVSCDPGYYICNALGYSLAHYIQQNELPVKQVFVHIPCTTNFKDFFTEEKFFFEPEILKKGLRMILRNI